MVASLLRTKYGDYINKDGTNNKGNKIEKTPSISYLWVRLTMPMGIYAKLDGNMIGKTYFDAQNKLAQKSYFTADTKLGYLKMTLTCIFTLKI